MTPTVCQPDRCVGELQRDVADLLCAGTNTIEVLLGNGWQNPFTTCSWGFQTAPWLSEPMICGAITADGRPVVETDGAWRAWDSPVVFTALRNGEWYDARLEGVKTRERAARLVRYVPFGAVRPEDAAPCRVFESFAPVRTLKAPDGADICDFGVNLTGWCEIEVVGAAGAKVTLDYDESLTPSNTLLGHVTGYVRRSGEPRPAQHDEYTLAGRAEGETWHPRFTYHGFRYAKVTVAGEATVRAIRARFVHSDFAVAGRLEASDPTFAALQKATLQSYLSNFTGIPTDCPHREKNGWTGDAQLACETGLWNFDARKGYGHFLRMMLDAQRPNGAVPCILPCTPTFGFFWGSGPAWDAALFVLPRQVFRFYGDDSLAREAYPALKRYLAFILAKRDGDGLVDYGLGDWCTVERIPGVQERCTDSAFVYWFCRELAFWAQRFGETDVAAAAEADAAAMRESFNRAFRTGAGVYSAPGRCGRGEMTALAAPLYFKGLCADGEEEKVAARLVAAVRANGHKADFGILGAKWVPRVLSDYGYVDDAWKLFTQPDYPGWANWLKSGDGTLHEDWDSPRSHNHIMFGDLSAWAYEYVAGIQPVEPGFRRIRLRPHLPAGVESFSASHVTPQGEIRVKISRVGGRPTVEVDVPGGIEVIE